MITKDCRDNTARWRMLASLGLSDYVWLQIAEGVA